ncbi:MAG: nitrile hydratase subunit beta [Pseudomonadota bacterium]
MNGAQDLGGRHGFGAVVPDPDDVLFHADWERRAFSLTLAAGATGTWTLDESRHARESLPPPVYLSSSYYEIWLMALERLLETHGLVSADERKTGAPGSAPITVKRVLRADAVTGVLASGGPVERAHTAPPEFEVGARVRTTRANPTTHTRLPAYARATTGTVVRVHGCHVFPDSNARGAGENPTWLYCVRFEAADLWGPDTTASAVHLDLWEPYLERG